MSIPIDSEATFRIREVAGGASRDRDDVLAVEEPLEIRLEYGPAGERSTRSLSVTMRTPGHDFELAAGFLFTEGILSAPGMARLGITLLAIAAICGLLLLLVKGPMVLWFGLVGVAIAVLYSLGPIPLSSTGLGEFAVGFAGPRSLRATLTGRSLATSRRLGRCRRHLDLRGRFGSRPSRRRLRLLGGRATVGVDRALSSRGRPGLGR